MARPATVVPVRYLDELFRTTAGVRLLRARVFPNAKEATESFGARNAVRRFADLFPSGDPDIVLVVVGDGTTPRTAATFAVTTAWDCHTVDPRLRTKTRWDNRSLRYDGRETAPGVDAVLCRSRCRASACPSLSRYFCWVGGQ